MASANVIDREKRLPLLSLAMIAASHFVPCVLLIRAEVVVGLGVIGAVIAGVPQMLDEDSGWAHRQVQ